MKMYDSAPDELSPDWDEDTIYCEAVAQPDDVFYEGSEDEDYDSPTARRAKYEEAGRRFLRGRAPMVLSATLRGPFDTSSGWVNPWRSKHRTAAPKQRREAESSRAVKHAKPTARRTILESPRAEVPDSPECHLPSPESLKQAALTEPHPYLEDDELAMVHSWRKAVRPGLAQEDFWASHAEQTPSTKKRRAKDVDWLKKPSTKRRKADIMESGAVNSPSRTRRRISRSSPRKDRDVDFYASFSSAPARLTTHARHSSSQRKSIGLATGCRGKDTEDELLDTSFPSFSSAPIRVSSPPKRVSPRRSLRKPASSKVQTIESEDELARDKAAAKTLSSPVSQEGVPRKRSQLRSSQFSQPSGQAIATRLRSTTQLPQSQVPDDGPIASTRKEGDVVMEDADEDSAALETQRDESFCYKRRPRADVEAKCEPQDGAEQEPGSPGSTVSTLTSLCSSCSGFSDDGLDNPLNTTKNTSLASAEGGTDNLGELDTKAETDLQIPVRTHTPEGVAQRDVTGDLSSKNEDKHSPDVEPETQDLWVPDVTNVENNDSNDGADETQNKPEPQSHDIVNAPTHSSVDLSQDTASCVLPISVPTKRASAESHAGPNDDTSREIEIHSSVDDTNLSPLQTFAEAPTPDDDGDARKTTRGLTPANDPCVADALPEPNDVTAAFHEATPVDKSDNSGPASSSFDADSGSSTHVAQVAKSASSESSLKNMLQRLVPSSPWARLSLLRRSTASQGTTVSVDEPVEPRGSSEDVVMADMATADEAVEEPQDPSRDITIAETTQIDMPDEHNLVISEPQDEISANTRDHIIGYSSSSTHDSLAVSSNAVDMEQTADDDTTAGSPSPLNESQQSPWVKPQLPQHAIMSEPEACAVDNLSATTPDRACDVSTTLPEVQTPWATQVDHLPAMINPMDAFHCTPAVTARPSTPEPQFTVKSFASFMSPSPRRQSRQLQRPRHRDSSTRHSPQSTWSSAMKSGCGRRSSHRVSWAPLPGEAAEAGSDNEHAYTPALSGRTRPASPPPKTSIADLTSSPDVKFRGHFSAMANRKSGLSKSFLSAASQQGPDSPMPLAMAEKFLAADEVRRSFEDVGTDELNMEDGSESAEMPMDESLDTQDPLVEEMFDDMAAILQGFDVDAELDEARKGNGITA